MRKILFIFLLFSHLAFATFDMSKNIQKSYHHILNLEFEEAKSMITLEEAREPNNGFIALHKNYIDFFTILINEDFNYFESRKKLKDDRFFLLDKSDQNSPYYLYAKAEISLQWAFSRLKFEQYPIAAYELINAYKLLKRNRKIFPDFNLNNKALGLIHALLSAVPEQYHWIINISGLEADFYLGMSQLESVLNDKDFSIYNDEVLFLLSFIQMNFGNDDLLSYKYLKIIGEKYKKNILLNFAAARLTYKLGKNNDCLKILSSRPDIRGPINFYYLDYLEAMSYLYELDFNNSIKKFKYFLSNYNGINYIKSANHKLALIAFLQKNYEDAKFYAKKVFSEGDNLIDVDRAALHDVKFLSPERSPVKFRLLRSRLLWDGGYYDKARNELSSIELSNYYPDFLEEYWYRLARIESKLNTDTIKLVEYYKRAYNYLGKSKDYYSPMAALQLGLIFEKRNNLREARFYLNRCLYSSGFIYEKGIHQKAKVALERIRD